MDRIQRERGSTIAQRLRAQFGADVDAIHQKYRELRQARATEVDAEWNGLREERLVLRAAQPRDYAAIEAVESRMRSLKRNPPVIATDDLDRARDEEIRALDNALAADLEALRLRAMEGLIEEDEAA